MRIGFMIVPILFGADKFVHMIVTWGKHLAPEFQHWISPFDTVHQTMYLVGAVEIVAEVVVLLLHGSVATSSPSGWRASSSTSRSSAASETS